MCHGAKTMEATNQFSVIHLVINAGVLIIQASRLMVLYRGNTFYVEVNINCTDKKVYYSKPLEKLHLFYRIETMAMHNV
jgi:formylmethanofuran dehydrogenase subunit A